MNTNEFRKELKVIMPGYKWTVHRPYARDPKYMTLEATGTITAGFNRLSTLSVEKRIRNGKTTYTVKSSGYGLRSRWLEESSDGTLARALRGLQERYESVAANYASHARYLQDARKGGIYVNGKKPEPVRIGRSQPQ